MRLPLCSGRLPQEHSLGRRLNPALPLKGRDPSRKKRAQDFACELPLARSRLHTGSKCNEALSRDLWPLEPFESAPMRATSSGMGYCILYAIQLQLKIKDLAEMLSGKAGSNSLPLKKLLCGFF